MTQTQIAPDFTLEDTRGNSITLSNRRNHLVVLIFASQATQEASREATKTLGLKLLHDARVDLWTIVSVPKMFKMMAMGMLKDVQNKAVESARRRFEKENATPPADLEERIYILPDWGGSLVERYGFDPKAKHVHVAVVGTDGNVIERLSSADGEKAGSAAAEAALKALQ